MRDCYKEWSKTYYLLIVCVSINKVSWQRANNTTASICGKGYKTNSTVMISPSVGGPGLSVVVNAAGITRDKSLLKMTEEAYDEVLKVNLKVCTLFSVSPMINKKGGGGVEHLEAVYALAQTLLHYYLLLREHGKRGGAASTFPPRGKHCSS